MNHRMFRRLRRVLIATALILALSSFPTFVMASDGFSEEITKMELLQMDQSNMLDTLLASGMKLPEHYQLHRDTAEYFVKTYTPMLLNGEVSAGNLPFNYAPSNAMLSDLESTLIHLHLLDSADRVMPTRYVLQNSIPIGVWSNSYTNYNCYAYSLGLTWWMNPGDQSGTPFDITDPISDIADTVLDDLTYSGFWGYKTTTKPSVLPDPWFRVICIRKDTDNVDYHFMRMSRSLNTWEHKPGGTQPLQWNFSSPGSAVWSNECVVNGTSYSPTVTYESTIYYIVYKGIHDPGIQQQKLSPEALETLFRG